MAATRTVRDLVTRALRVATIVGAGEVPDADDAADALLSLNLMLDAWQAERLYVFAVVERLGTLVAGTATYTVGAGATFNVPRPQRIEWAYTRDSQNYDRDVDVVPDQVFAAISLKSLGNVFPTVLWYETAYPLGVIHLWPLPPAGLVLHFGAWTVLSEYTSLNDAVSLPPGYEDAIVFSLAERICPEYGKAVSPDLMKQAINARANIQQDNLPDMRVMCEFTGGDSRPLGYGDYVAGNF